MLNCTTTYPACAAGAAGACCAEHVHARARAMFFLTDAALGAKTLTSTAGTYMTCRYELANNYVTNQN
eukprot:1034091-Pleurochrysis_carterae.AAC.2